MLPADNLGVDPKEQLYDGVGYSADALINVLQSNQLKVELTMKQDGRLYMFDARLEALKRDEPRAIVVGTRGHWVALVKQGDSWFNADSLNDMRASKACGMLSPVRYFSNGIDGVIKYIKRMTPVSGGILEIR